MYLITFNNNFKEPFFTKWYDYTNNWIEGMYIFDLTTGKWSRNGIDWDEIETAHL